MLLNQSKHFVIDTTPPAKKTKKHRLESKEVVTKLLEVGEKSAWKFNSSSYGKNLRMLLSCTARNVPDSAKQANSDDEMASRIQNAYESRMNTLSKPRVKKLAVHRVNAKRLVAGMPPNFMDNRSG